MSDAVTLRRLGLAHAKSSDLDSALECLEKARSLEPLHVATLVNLGAVYQALGRDAEALARLEEALLVDPSRAEIFNNRALSFRALRALPAAIESAKQALALRPQYPEAWVNLGTAQHDNGEVVESVESFREAIRLRSDYDKAYANLGYALQEIGELRAAAECFEKALALNPAMDNLLGASLHADMRLCRWENLQPRVAQLISTIRSGLCSTSPFVVLNLIDDPQLHQLAARNTARQWSNVRDSKHSHSPTPRLAKTRHQRIKVAYFSADYFNHATTHLIAGLIENHDRQRFEIIGFSIGPSRHDASAQRIRAAFDNFFEIHHLDDGKAVDVARKLGIDIGVDLKGYTQQSRPGLFAARTAPIQASFLGYPGTLGLPEMDYLIADETLIPQPLRAYYDEKIVFMPHAYQCNDRRPEPTNLDTFQGRKRLGLPKDAFVFCCFNNSFKITPAVFRSWMRIVRTCDDSVLWLLQDNDASAANLRAEASRAGVEPTRLVFAPRTQVDEHLARHRFADLFLDTTPYNAHTSASDALWMGLPIVTQIGRSFPSRVAASLLKAVGLPELITHTSESYESLAIELAKNKQRLGRIRMHLEGVRHSTPLFNPVTFARHLERAYVMMTENLRLGLEPVDIKLTSMDG